MAGTTGFFSRWQNPRGGCLEEAQEVQHQSRRCVQGIWFQIRSYWLADLRHMLPLIQIIMILSWLEMTSMCTCPNRNGLFCKKYEYQGAGVTLIVHSTFLIWPISELLLRAAYLRPRCIVWATVGSGGNTSTQFDTYWHVCSESNSLRCGFNSNRAEWSNLRFLRNGSCNRLLRLVSQPLSMEDLNNGDPGLFCCLKANGEKVEKFLSRLLGRAINVLQHRLSAQTICGFVTNYISRQSLTQQVLQKKGGESSETSLITDSELLNHEWKNEWCFSPTIQMFDVWYVWYLLSCVLSGDRVELAEDFGIYWRHSWQ